MTMHRGELVSATTHDGLLLHGFFSPPDSIEKGIVISIHGFEGNFYENTFVRVIVDALSQKGIGFLTVNTRGNGKATNFNTTSGTIKTIGAWYEVLEDAWIDIDAWVEFIDKKGFTGPIYVQGHSLGTMKVVRYLFEGTFRQRIAKLILLAPFDKNVLLKHEAKQTVSELLPVVKDHIAQGRGNALLESEHTNRVTSHTTFASWYEQDDLGSVFLMENEETANTMLSKINQPTLIVVGSNDEYFYQNEKDVYAHKLDVLTRRFPNAQGVLLPTADHSFSPKENELADIISTFCLS